MSAKSAIDEAARDGRSYEEQVQQQIEQYRDVEDMHALPEAFHLWSHSFIGPGFRAVYGVQTIPEFYASAFLAASAGVERPTFVSLGCGAGEMEISVARLLVEGGLKRFRFVCLDLSPLLLERFRASIPADLAEYFEVELRDLNGDALNEPVDAVMANHSLHHMVDLEGIFAAVWRNLTPAGIFATTDMIGRNGHQRWPETKLFVDYFWPFLTERQRRHAVLSRTDMAFQDHDCSSEGFEGVRAQDILPILVAQGFKAQRFLSLGGFIDPFVDRGYGHGFKPDNPDDVFLIRRMALLNDVLLDAGAIKPTMMFAWFSKAAREPIFYRGRTLEAAVRMDEPVWVQSAADDLASLGAPDYVYRSPPSTVAAQAQRIADLERSTSWRITAPLRWLAAKLRRS